MRLILLEALLLLGAQVALLGESRDEEASVTELVGGHLDQAASLGNPLAAKGKPRTAEELSELQTEVWIDRVSALPRKSPLLESIPEEIWNRVEPICQDDKSVQQILDEPVSLPVLLALVALRDPQIRSSHEALAASVRRIPQAAYLSDLMIRYRAFLREINPAVGFPTHKEKPQNTYPFPAGLTLKGQIAELQVELARIEYESVLRRRLNRAAQDAFELQYTDKAIEITEGNRTLLANMESTAIVQLRVGRASQADALIAQTMLNLLDDRLYALERGREIIVARLSSSLLLHNTGEWTWIGLEMRPPGVDLSRLIDQAQRTNQDLASSRRRLKLLEASTKLVETSLPLASSPASRIDLNSGAEAGPTRNAQVTFPEKAVAGHGSVKAGQNLAYLEELSLNQRALSERVRSTAADVEFQVRAASARFAAAEHGYQVRNDLVVPKLKRVFNTTLERYNTDRVSFIEFAGTGRDYLDALVARERAQYDRNLSLIGIQDSIGRTVLDLLSSGAKE